MKFFFLYKSLAHPELVGHYVQPFTLAERLAQARRAEEELGASIPWLVDAMDNRLRHALKGRANSEYILDPNGIIVRKRAFSSPAEVRRDLEQMVGPVKHITRVEDVRLSTHLPLSASTAHGVLPRIPRQEMLPIVVEPHIDPKGLPFYAKLRAEADNDLLNSGRGKLYLGFDLDPLYNAHWNNLIKPLSFRLQVPDGVSISPAIGTAPKVKVAADADPREFLLDVGAWPKTTPIQLSVAYYACAGEEACYAVKQQYVLRLRPNRDGGRAFTDAGSIAQRMMIWDRDGDGKLNPTEARMDGSLFRHFDTDKDGLLDPQELKAVWLWLNNGHRTNSGQNK